MASALYGCAGTCNKYNTIQLNDTFNCLKKEKSDFPIGKIGSCLTFRLIKYISFVAGVEPGFIYPTPIQRAGVE
jgi:hypothetical protein